MSGSDALASMADTGFLFVPRDCAAGQPCRVHVAFHGCRQGIGFLGRTFARQTGYDRWADANRIVVLYPQVRGVEVLAPQSARLLGLVGLLGRRLRGQGRRTTLRRTPHARGARRKMTWHPQATCLYTEE